MDDMDYVMDGHGPSNPQPHQPQQSGCPYWRDTATRSSLNRNAPSNFQYDSVNNLFFPQPAPPSLPFISAGGPSLAAHPPAHHSRPSSEPYYSPGPALAGTPGGPSGPVPTPPVQNHGPPHPPHHDLPTSFPFAFRHTSALHHPRFGQQPPPPPQLSQTNQPNHPASHQVSFTPDRSIPAHSASRMSLPPLNPPQIPQQQPAMSNPGESSPAAPQGQAGASSRPPFITSTGSMLSGLPEPPRTHPSTLGAEAPRTDPTSNPIPAGSTPDADAAAPLLPTTPPAPPNTERRRQAATLRQSSSHANNNRGSDYDSDDEADFPDILEDEQNALRFIEQHLATGAPIPLRVGDVDEARIRAHQLLRGQLSSKRVASKGALSSLQSVEISSLPESERMCVICYNEFGVRNPEGINEAPLRLPRCKHVFGDHCIKKWFEESDSCPYCRDKVPSEPQFRANYEALRDFFLRSSYTSRQHARPPPVGENRGGTAGSASTLSMHRAEAEAYVRYMSQRDENRYDGSPPRAWHTGDRRSPPSEAPEMRRRTRPRHGSVRTLPSNNGPSNSRPNSFGGVVPSAPPQPSPARERLSAASHGPFNYNGGGPGGGRQMPPVMPLHLDPLGLGPVHMSNTPHPGFTPPLLVNPGLHEQAYPHTHDGGAGMSHMEPPAIGLGGNFSGVPGVASFFQDLPPLAGPSYPTASNGSGNHSPQW